MMKYVHMVVLFICVCHVVPIAASRGECGEEIVSKDAVRISIGSGKNETGRWVTAFSLSKDDSEASEHNNSVSLDLSQEVTECSGRKTFRLRGHLSDLTPPNVLKNDLTKDNKLFFHTKCGTNVAVLSDGRTIRKINLEEGANGLVFTQRPLKINEILEVKLEKLHSKYSYSLAIGVTTLSPEDAVLPTLPHINSIKNGSWAWYNTNTYRNGNEYVKNYGKNLNTLQLGGRIGVMRSNTGSLHFYWNGVDQGPAASNIPQTVYGVVELDGNAAGATIVSS